MMQEYRTTAKIICAALFLLLLVSSTKRETQPFIFFGQTKLKPPAGSYFTTDLYDPSNVRAIPVIGCYWDPQSARNPEQPIWSPNGKYYACSAVYDKPLLIYDIHNTIMAQLAQDNPSDPVQWSFLDWSPDSQYVIIGNTGSPVTPYEDLSIMKYDGTQIHSIDKQTAAGFSSGAKWSPNGKFIAYQITSYVSNNSFIVISDPSGKQYARFDLSEMTQTPAFAFGVTWSSDSKRLAFSTETGDTGESRWKIYMLDIQSGQLTDVVHDNSLCNFEISGWSSYNGEILFKAVKCTDQDWSDPATYSINMDGSQLKQLTPKGYGTLYLTPDGQAIIMSGYTSRGINELDLEGNDTKELLTNGDFVSWVKP
jgi:Tol biopolymer transport system component